MIKPASDDGCHAFAEELEKKFTLFSDLLTFLEKNDEIWKQLQQQYLTRLTDVKAALCDLLYTSGDKSLQHALTMVSDSSGKIYLFDMLNAMEEARLLLVILSEWTHRFTFFVSALPSKNSLLAMTASDAHRFENSYSWLNGENESTGWALTSARGGRKYSALRYGSIIQAGFGKPFQNPFANPDYNLMKLFFEKKLYEPLILHFAAGSGSCYFCPDHPVDHQAFVFPGELNMQFMPAVTDECNNKYKNGFEATHFMVLITLFAVDKLPALRNAYQYYTAYYNGDSVAVEKSRSTIDPAILLWLTAILGRYDIFLSVKKPDSFDFAALVGTKTFGTYNKDLINLDRYHYTPELNRSFAGQYFVQTHNYTSPMIPLMIAAKLNRVDVVEGLLKEYCEHGKDIGLLKKDFNGDTPAEIAFKHGHYSLSTLLDSHSHTLSHYRREVVEREVRKNRTLAETTKGSIVNALSLGGIFAQRLTDNYRENEQKNSASSSRTLKKI